MPNIQNPPFAVPLTDPKTGNITLPWQGFILRLYERIGGATQGLAPNSATYITKTANSDLSNEQALSLLNTGFVQVTTGSGILSSTGSSTIQTADIGNNQVTTAKLNDLAVTTGKLDADAVTNAKIADLAVSLEHLDSGISPSYFVKYAGTFTTVGGDANEVISVSGCASTDIAFVVLKARGATPVTIIQAAAATNQIDVLLSADPSNDHVLAYCVLRATS